MSKSEDVFDEKIDEERKIITLFVCNAAAICCASWSLISVLARLSVVSVYVGKSICF
jgi:hypothetical protein